MRTSIVDEPLAQNLLVASIQVLAALDDRFATVMNNGSQRPARTRE